MSTALDSLLHSCQELRLELDEARFKICSLERELSSQCQASASVGSSLRSIAQLCTGFRATFNQALTQMAHYERRVAFAAKRTRSLKGIGGKNCCTVSKCSSASSLYPMQPLWAAGKHFWLASQPTSPMHSVRPVEVQRAHLKRRGLRLLLSLENCYKWRWKHFVRRGTI